MKTHWSKINYLTSNIDLKTIFKLNVASVENSDSRVFLTSITFKENALFDASSTFQYRDTLPEGRRNRLEYHSYSSIKLIHYK